MSIDVSERAPRQGQKYGTPNRKLLHHVQQDTQDLCTPKKSGVFLLLAMSQNVKTVADDQSDVHGEEADVARTKTLPPRPYAAEVAEHEVKQPFRSWCTHCTQGRARDETHRRQDDPSETAVSNQIRRLLHRSSQEHKDSNNCGD